MLDEIFKVLDDQFKSTGMAYWACRACTQYAKMMNHKMREIETELEKVKESCQNNQGELKKVQEEVAKLADKVDTQAKKVDEAAAAVANAGAAGIFEEIKERENKRLNVVMHGMGEAPPDHVGRARWDWDLQSCTNLFKELKLPITAEAIRFVRRVGEAGEQPRPLVVGFHEERDKTRLLRADTRKTCFNDVDIVPDLTKAQRREEDDLRTEMVQRNKRMPSEDRAKNLAWVVVGPRGGKRLVKKYIDMEEEKAAGRRSQGRQAGTAVNAQRPRPATGGQQPPASMDVEEVEIDTASRAGAPPGTAAKTTMRGRLPSKRGRGVSTEAEEPPQTRTRH
jgi:23S rRNA pseudoU1915 N3-methylase RlmH